jgi:hypothetical protein
VIERRVDRLEEGPAIRAPCIFLKRACDLIKACILPAVITRHFLNVSRIDHRNLLSPRQRFPIETDGKPPAPVSTHFLWVCSTLGASRPKIAPSLEALQFAG